MKKTKTYSGLLFVVLILAAFSTYANDPTLVPWPVGSTEIQMDSTKTLMNSYGDPNGEWSNGIFHAGIDIDSYTESPSCDEVRSVLDGNVVISNMSLVSHHNSNKDNWLGFL